MVRFSWRLAELLKEFGDIESTRHIMRWRLSALPICRPVFMPQAVLPVRMKPRKGKRPVVLQ
jgi:hypothetical protein